MVNIDKSVVEQTFDLIGENYGQADCTEGEVTAKIMHETYPELTKRQWLNRLHQGVKDGKLVVRDGKGGEKIFKPND